MSSLMLKLIVNMKISRNTNHFSSKFITTISYKTKAETRHNDTDYFVHFSGQPVILLNKPRLKSNKSIKRFHFQEDLIFA